jgi:metal-dependent HD superfamily phosphatase/phosphodiesterase
VPKIYKSMSTISLDEVRKNAKIKAYIEGANDVLYAMGYTEHGLRHAGIVGNVARMICLKLGYSARQAELAAIAGFMHDIGNVINRKEHAQIGGTVAFKILEDMGMDPDEITVIVSAIGNHEETTGQPVNYASAAVILADKSDVHYSRVQNPDRETFDIHDRVNYATQRSRLQVHKKEKVIELELTIDANVASLMEYFEIFLERMTMCRKAATLLDCEFHIQINGTQID